MSSTYDLTRPYLVIPKLIEQPTWGGSYIATAKGWQERPGLDCKIGQSYELFSGSNLSLLTHSDDPAFTGELTNRDAAPLQTHPGDAIALADLIATNPVATLGQAYAAAHHNQLVLLAKFTQALGNSFQVHIPAGASHTRWHPKPESWYFFEPGMVTIGVKHGTDWDDYNHAVVAVRDGMDSIGQQIKDGQLTLDQAQPNIQSLLQQYNPWQYVNTLATQKDQLIDLSLGGQHHSWEEDAQHAPHGNVLYELQLDVMDDVSTLRCFDKGKLGADGSIRDVHIDDYFAAIDRSAAANDPQQHIKHPVLIAQTENYALEQLMRSPYYCLDKLTLPIANAQFTDSPDQFKHLFIKEGSATVSAGGQSLQLTSGHSCFIPAAATSYTVIGTTANTQILISY